MVNGGGGLNPMNSPPHRGHVPDRSRTAINDFAGRLTRTRSCTLFFYGFPSGRAEPKIVNNYVTIFKRYFVKTLVAKKYFRLFEKSIYSRVKKVPSHFDSWNCPYTHSRCDCRMASVRGPAVQMK